EIWSYGEDNMEIMKKFIDIRNGLKDYIEGLVKEASLTGMPLIRAMYLEFPDDPEAAASEDQYMFGGSLLVAPVLEAGARSREVYLPEGTWEDFYSGEQIEGGRVIKADAPLDKIPVFRRR
ncbi:MAG: alpha-glucosidase, partial [Clostridiales bacterium]|nr:alpha-glucosidase [Clostridiales bacterium]